MSNDTDAEVLRPTAHHLADLARGLSLRWFRRAVATDYKDDASPVTRADREVERAMRQAIAQRHPGHGIAGEEFGGERLDAAWTWYLDPIDGTRSFISGLPLWGTLIALTHRGVPVLGVLDAPAQGERWSAYGGDALFQARDGAVQRCRTSACSALARARLCLPAPDAFDAAQADAVRRLSGEVRLRRYGGDCYSYGLLASGHLDLIVEAGLDDHDFLPFVPLIESAGGVVSDWQGRPLRPDSGGDVVAACTRALHREALDWLAARD